IIILLTATFFSSCSMFKKDVPNVIKFENIIIYNNDFDSLSSLLIKDSSYVIDSIGKESDLIVSSYISTSICFLSPSKDTILSKGNLKVTGIVDYGTESYPYAPSLGYFDMEFINVGHWYYIKTENNIYSRIFVKSYNEESVIISLEILADTGTYFGE
ncbi:MAG: hypothetical protein COX48_00005, partial [bacterium (Candidatus Stahlbacteria) CG23_combo_of_CG06-09_8_20_14_all_34_7]